MRESIDDIIKRQDEAFAQCMDFGELYKALRKCCRGVRWKDSVIGYESNGLKNTYILQEELLSGTYKISPYHKFTIREPKPRRITALHIRDRQFQRSFRDKVLYPEIANSFIYDNLACQIGKGTDKAHERMKTHLRRYCNKHGNEGWCVALDIYHYFEETLHEISRQMVATRIKSPSAYSMCSTIIGSFGSGEKGTDLGSDPAQLIQLLVLNDIDHYFKDTLRIKTYLRYNDDVFILVPTKEEALYLLNILKKLLRLKGLRANKKTRIYPMKDGMLWLKWVYRILDSGKIIKVPIKSKASTERRRLRKMKEKLDAGIMTMDDIQAHYQGWLANVEKGNTHMFIYNMNKYYKELFGEEYPYIPLKQRKREANYKRNQLMPILT